MCASNDRARRSPGRRVMEFAMGSEFIVTRKRSDRTVPATAEDDHGEPVDSWRAVVDGLRWIRKLCEAGKGVDLGGDGCPSRFSLPARRLGGILRGETPAGCKVRVGPESSPSRIVPDLDLKRGVAAQVEASESLLLTVFDTSYAWSGRSGRSTSSTGGRLGSLAGSPASRYRCSSG